MMMSVRKATASVERMMSSEALCAIVSDSPIEVDISTLYKPDILILRRRKVSKVSKFPHVSHVSTR
jgi:hypothetical protein